MKELIINTIPFEYKPSALNESISGGKLLVTGILQRANAKNQNGRIYPKPVLLREVEKYNINFVKSRRALGELDHAECFREGEVLTSNGWKDLKDVTTNDIVATLDMNTDSIVYQPVNKVIQQDYSGKLISIKGKNIDVNVTPNHRFVARDRKGNLVIKTAQEILDLSTILKQTDLIIPVNYDNAFTNVTKNNNGIDLDFRFIKITEYDYTGKIYCLNVDNGTFYYRNNLHQHWTGNSSVVNLKNVSHNITEMHWDNDDLVGTLEILQTPNGNILKDLLKAGILIGISSRGLGSVKNDMHEGADVVQDDFDLICFDVVSTPSTQGAFMREMHNSINESVNKKTKTNIINPVYLEIDNIIRDILINI